MAKPLRLRVRRKSVVWWPVVTRSNHIKYCAMLVRWIGLCMMLPEVSFSCILPVTRIAKIHRLPEGERPQRGLIATVGNFLLPSAHGCRFCFRCSAHVRSTELTCSSHSSGASLGRKACTSRPGPAPLGSWVSLPLEVLRPRQLCRINLQFTAQGFRLAAKPARHAPVLLPLAHR